MASDGDLSAAASAARAALDAHTVETVAWHFHESTGCPFWLEKKRELKFDRELINVKGGGISVGHPIGMSGARIVLALAYEMRARGAAIGLATLCISGGQGLAVVLERA